MKFPIKAKAEKTVQRNLRVALSINEQMNQTAALADEVGVDYHSTLVAALQQFDADLRARLLEMKAQGQRATSSGIIPGSDSLPDPVEHPNPRMPVVAGGNGIAIDRRA